MKSLEEYLKENNDMGIIDHRIRVIVNKDGNPEFYIHALGHDSDTLDFKVEGNILIPKR